MAQPKYVANYRKSLQLYNSVPRPISFLILKNQLNFHYKQLKNDYEISRDKTAIKPVKI